MIDITSIPGAVALFCLTSVVTTGIICNTITRIKQQKYDYKLSTTPEWFSYKLQKEEQKIRLTAELYRSNSGSEGIEAKQEDHPSS